MMVTNNKITYCRNFENETDQADARPPYSRVTTLHSRKVKSYELDVACSKLKITKSTLVFKKNQNKKRKLNDT